ncbi:hypothetical protein EDB85DRAFT_1889901 [Lactarius pseudohatsudake]|nr:hypothetical protein EDB85DRAFT_1889901 [Lactarius pseudohatsudake]
MPTTAATPSSLHPSRRSHPDSPGLFSFIVVVFASLWSRCGAGRVAVEFGAGLISPALAGRWQWLATRFEAFGSGKCRHAHFADAAPSPTNHATTQYFNTGFRQFNYNGSGSSGPSHNYDTCSGNAATSTLGSWNGAATTTGDVDHHDTRPNDDSDINDNDGKNIDSGKNDNNNGDNNNNNNNNSSAAGILVM